MSDGDGSFDAFFASTWKRIVAFASRRVGADAAADVASESMLIVWQKWDSRPTGDGDAVLHWALAITKNKVLHEWRRSEGHQKLVSKIELVMPPTPGGDESAESIALSKIAVVDSFQRLTAADQAALLRDDGVDDEVDRERAASPRIRRGTQSMRRTRARRRLLDGLG